MTKSLASCCQISWSRWYRIYSLFHQYSRSTNTLVPHIQLLYQWHQCINSAALPMRSSLLGRVTPVVALILLSINTVAPHALVFVTSIRLLHQCSHSHSTDMVALTSQLLHQGSCFTKAVTSPSGRSFGGMGCVMHVDILLLQLLY